MNLPLSPDLKTFVQTQVDSGRYLSEEAVCVAALEAFLEQEQHRQARLAVLHEAVMVGAAEADRGELLDGESAMQALRDKLESQYLG
jgi:antitoxin ParD1/3/4